LWILAGRTQPDLSVLGRAVNRFMKRTEHSQPAGRAETAVRAQARFTGAGYGWRGVGRDGGHLGARLLTLLPEVKFP
jgi:hypothetical protein